jgi:hypothetical protein
MGLLTGEGLATEMQAFAEVSESLDPLRLHGRGTQHVIQPSPDQFLQRGLALGRYYLGAVQEVIGQINRRFHGQ